MSKVLEALTKYTSVLSRSAESTNYADDRPIYTKHLAEAARFFVLAHEGRIPELVALVHDERRPYGWGYLSGDVGAQAESAFNDFATFIESLSA
ncbi:MAG TPA: hypothetical protein VGK14_05430 [Novimethylophilus sp.]|jgi:hypothetical protein|uniref:hypothetical protein n=1 Tax=Novimethylophilus sp. TaxID=2137426 RepID=UPI002F4135E7